MGKAKMYGMNKPFIPNSKVDQMNRRFKRKAKKRREARKQWLKGSVSVATAETTSAHLMKNIPV